MAPERRSDVEQRTISEEQSLRELRLPVLGDDLLERVGASLARQHLRGWRTTGDRPMSASVGRQHRLEHLRLRVQVDVQLREHAEELHRRQAGIDRGIVSTRARADVGDADAVVPVQCAEISCARDGRRYEGNEKTCQIGSDFEQRITHVRTRTEDGWIVAACGNAAHACGSQELVPPCHGIDGCVASGLACVRKLHRRCRPRRK